MTVVSVSTLPRSGSAVQEGERFRPDIQALRAIAVVSVLVYHLWPHRLTGGFVGVDVFFVVSGFLITSHLLHELDRTGRIAVVRFWARRAKRLLPASLLVLVLVTIAVLAWVPKALWPQFLWESTASVLYVQNWYLAFSSVDYSAAGNAASPVQHYWTLSVEEQFYIVLPLVIVLSVLVSSRLGRPRTIALCTIGVLSAASFGYSVWYSGWSASEAYFSTATRAWEFGVGAMVSWLPAVTSRRVRSLSSGVGLFAIAAAMLLLGPSTPFPGSIALIPVLGTALVLWAGTGTFVQAIGAFAPVRMLGRISYAVYLWHWPPIVLLPFVTGHALTTVEKVVIFVSSMVIAWLSTRYWEDKIRFSHRLLGRAKPRLVLSWSAAAMVVALVVPVAALTFDATERARAAANTADVLNSPPSCFGAATLAEECENPDLAGVLVPAPAEARYDDANRAACWSGGRDDRLNVCALGPRTGYDLHLLAVGDSHNNTLVGAYEKIARERNWRIDVAGRAGCYWTTAPLVQPTVELDGVCARWRERLAKHIAQAEVDAIVTTKSRRPLDAELADPSRPDAFDLVVDGMVEAWGARADASIPVIALLDNPRLPEDVLTCIEQAGEGAAAQCSISRSRAFALRDGLQEAVQRASNAHVVDLSDLYCSAQRCSPIVGGALVYRDGNHLTATYASTIAPYLGERIAAILDGRTQPPA